MPVKIGSNNRCYIAKLIPSDASLNKKDLTNTNAGNRNLYAFSAYNAQKELRTQPQIKLRLHRIHNIFHTFFARGLLPYLLTQNASLCQPIYALLSMSQIFIVILRKQGKVKIFP